MNYSSQGLGVHKGQESNWNWARQHQNNDAKAERINDERQFKEEIVWPWQHSDESRLITNVAVNIANRVDPPHHAIGTCANIANSTNDVGPRIRQSAIASERVDSTFSVDSAKVAERVR